MRRTLLLALVALSFVSIAGCKRSSRSGGGTGGGSSWLVGRDGTMLRYDHLDHAVSDYALDAEVDLTDIACRGADQAWVVGQRGTLYRTVDGGEVWEAIELSTTADLFSVAAAGLERVWVAGDGVVLTSADAGLSWRVVPTPAARFTAIATTYDGTLALATTADGAIYRLDPAAATQVHAGAIALRSIAVTADGARAIAVGDDGTALRSDDGGLGFAPLATGLAADLLAIHQVSDGSLAVAVGAGGAIVRIGDDGVTAETLLTDDLALRSLHLSSSGVGMAVGDAGTALVTHDAGRTWEQVELGVAVTLTGVDDLHGEPHL